jgi:hypothetical protein
MMRAAMLHTRVAMQPADDLPDAGAPPPVDPTSRAPDPVRNATPRQPRWSVTASRRRFSIRSMHWAVARAKRSTSIGAATDRLGTPSACGTTTTMAYLQTARDYASLIAAPQAGASGVSCGCAGVPLSAARRPKT